MKNENCKKQNVKSKVKFRFDFLRLTLAPYGLDGVHYVRQKQDHPGPSGLPGSRNVSRLVQRGEREGQLLPKPKAPADKKECVESKEYIRVHHKDLLEDWKQSVVREGRRTYEATNKKTYVMSLNRTCMSCHRDKAEFCDQCHNYVGVTNKCWDCHLFPKQEIKG